MVPPQRVQRLHRRGHRVQHAGPRDRDEHVRGPGRDRQDGQLGVRRDRVEPEGAEDLGRVELRPEHGRLLEHRRAAVADPQRLQARVRLLHELAVGPAATAQHGDRRAQRRVARERHLVPRRPDPRAVGRAGPGRGLHERRLDEAGFAREGEHRAVVEVVRVVDDGDRVAGHRRRREDVHPGQRVRGRHGREPPGLEVEVSRGLLLEPEPVVLRRLLEELGRLLQHVLALGLLVGGHDVAGSARSEGRRSASSAATSGAGGSGTPVRSSS